MRTNIVESRSWNDIPWYPRVSLQCWDQDVHWLTWEFDRLGIHHVKLLDHIMGVLRLANESFILHLLDLKSKEELQFTHHGHLKSLNIILLNSSQYTWLILPNIMSSTYIWHINISLPTLWVKKGRIGFAYFKALFKQEFLKTFIPYSWCLLKPIEWFLEFIDMFEKLVIFKVGSCLT